jgi:hypothetical protein
VSAFYRGASGTRLHIGQAVQWVGKIHVWRRCDVCGLSAPMHHFGQVKIEGQVLDVCTPSCLTLQHDVLGCHSDWTGQLSDEELPF